jgi:hypothetical protein
MYKYFLCFFKKKDTDNKHEHLKKSDRLKLSKIIDQLDIIEKHEQLKRTLTPENIKPLENIQYIDKNYRALDFCTMPEIKNQHVSDCYAMPIEKFSITDKVRANSMSNLETLE